MFSELRPALPFVSNHLSMALPSAEIQTGLTLPLAHHSIIMDATLAISIIAMLSFDSPWTLVGAETLMPTSPKLLKEPLASSPI